MPAVDFQYSRFIFRFNLLRSSAELVENMYKFCLTVKFLSQFNFTSFLSRAALQFGDFPSIYYEF